MIKPTIPSGTRDFSPEEVYKRQFIFNTIRSVFEKYGYQAIETPTMENLSTLEGKYGEEGDKLLFRVMNSGVINNPQKEKEFSDLLNRITKDIAEKGFSDSLVIEENLSEEQKAKMEKSRREYYDLLVEKGLRYDLTIPFARYVVMHQNEITFPFKRYQIQPVFRADRPQRGRYREFVQCDADVVGSDSLLNEVELIQMYIEVFKKLRVPFKVWLNSKKILQGFAEIIGAAKMLSEIATSIDKLDKIGFDGVRTELRSKGLSTIQVDELFQYFKVLDVLNNYQTVFKNSITGQKGAEELIYIMHTLNESGYSSFENVGIDLRLARGLNYYTGTIIEVKPNDVKMGSVGGGGRYDDLTGMFGLKGVSGVGISFGADRIYDVMEELKLFPASAAKGTQVLFCYFDDASMNYCLPLVKKVREAGIAAEIYPSAEKMKKQLKYANDKKIPFVIVVGDNEMLSGKLAFKDMESGEQTAVTIEEIIQRLK